MPITEEQTIWYPGIYHGREGVYAQIARDISGEELVRLVQQRAKEDGEWAIANGRVGENNENEPLMRKMMEWVSRPENIGQCAAAHFDEGVTVDFICRDLANDSKWVGSSL